jgi:hypothetical protein
MANKLIRMPAYNWKGNEFIPMVAVDQGDGTYTLAVGLTVNNIDIGKVDQGAAGASPWLVSGTVTSNQGAAGATAWPVSIPASDLHLGQVGGSGGPISGSFAGASGSFVSGSGTMICPTGGSPLEIPNFFRNLTEAAYVTDISIESSAAGMTNQIKMHFLNAIPTQLETNASAYVEKFADREVRQGYYTMPPMTSAPGAGTDTSRATTKDRNNQTYPTQAVWIKVKPNGSTSLFIYLENLTAANIGANVTWYVKLTPEQD